MPAEATESPGVAGRPRPGWPPGSTCCPAWALGRRTDRAGRGLSGRGRPDRGAVRIAAAVTAGRRHPLAARAGYALALAVLLGLAAAGPVLGLVTGGRGGGWR
ncbi:hypothetical protein GXW82_28090 [Streptacidiphilus sp. 4-A2]|nr:hypothetical protein [Streptacidiphilus sp. 4-A2]